MDTESYNREQEGSGTLLSVTLTDDQLIKLLEEREPQLVDRMAEKVYKRCEQWYLQKEKRLKQAYNYEEVRDILGLKSTRTVGDRVRNDNFCLKAEGRNTGTPFITKDELYTHCVNDLGMDPGEAFELVY